MAGKKPNNRIIAIKPELESVLVCNNSKLSPFIQILVQNPENIDSQNLGILLGIFEVTDYSEDSSYLVNYIISVIKKEYFSKPKRGPIESFEASLHKANLALSGLAEHGHISWIGKLNALVAITEKNGFHFSQTGNTSAFLLRAKSMTGISDSAFPAGEELNPLKTFIHISSGRMEKNDKLIIATSEIFDIFSSEELKKSALRFSKKDFLQFLRTALTSELEKAAVLIIDFHAHESVTTPVKSRKTTPKKFNPFSNDTFKEIVKKDEVFAEEMAEDELYEEIQKSQSEFVDKKTGHIYIKESADKYFPQENNKSLFDFNFHQLIIAFAEKNFNLAKKHLSSLKMLVLSFFGKIYQKEDTPTQAQAIQSTPWKTFFLKTKILCTYFKTFFPNLSPNFQKIKNTFLKMDYAQRLYGFLILIFIFVVPYFIAQYLDKKTSEQSSNSVPTIVATQERPLSKDDLVHYIENLSPVYSGSEKITRLLKLNEHFFLLTESSLIDMESKSRFSFPAGFETPLYAKEMDDLSLIFILDSKNKLLSFSPVSGNFQENSLPIPANSKISAMGTYLTYLYLADSENNQIYRYPRTEGGFSEKTNWLKDSIEVKHIFELAVDENLFFAQKQGITRMFKGKLESFSLENSPTPLSLDAFYFEKESRTFFILDKTNSRVIHFNPDGKISSQYHNQDIERANSLACSIKESVCYLTIENEIKTLSL